MAKHFLLLLMLTLTGTGCSHSEAASQPELRLPSYAIAQTERTALGDALAPGVAANPGKSGFRVLTTGSESFSMRLALVRAAERTLDLQYYTIHDDTTSNLLLEAVIQAARRGVRIRFLIDNITLKEVDKSFSLLDGLPNLEIRVFNPVATRHDGLLTRIAIALSDIRRLERRMHNKVMIADNQLAITGGRNLGDEYFEENTDMAFRDIDLLTAGVITADISRSFDRYWNSKDSVPIKQLHAPQHTPEKIRKINAALEKHWDEVLHTEKGKKLLQSKLHERLKNGDVKLIWAKAELAVDEPHKIDEAPETAHSRPMGLLAKLVDKAHTEFIAVSPYFVPRKEGVEWLKSLTERGLSVKILTNSLASTDVVAVHTGYAPYREEVVDSGVDLYEMKPILGKRPRQRLIGSTAPAHASLHSKVYVVDGRDVMIGSFNLDPRSIELNTEIAVVMHSEAIARQVMDIFNEVIEPDSSYHIVRVKESDDPDGEGYLAWKTQEDGKDIERSGDPDAGLIRRVQSGLMSLLPLEDHL